MSIVAALDKVLFFNASSKYSVLRMKTEDSSVPAEARSPYRYHDHLIRFTAVGIELPQTDSPRRRDPGSVDSVPCSYPRTRNQSKVVFHHIAQIFHRDLILL